MGAALVLLAQRGALCKTLAFSTSPLLSNGPVQCYVHICDCVQKHSWKYSFLQYVFALPGNVLAALRVIFVLGRRFFCLAVIVLCFSPVGVMILSHQSLHIAVSLLQSSSALKRSSARLADRGRCHASACRQEGGRGVAFAGVICFGGWAAGTRAAAATNQAARIQPGGRDFEVTRKLIISDSRNAARPTYPRKRRGGKVKQGLEGKAEGRRQNFGLPCPH